MHSWQTCRDSPESPIEQEDQRRGSDLTQGDVTWGQKTSSAQPGASSTPLGIRLKTPKLSSIRARSSSLQKAVHVDHAETGGGASRSADSKK